jgi:hypothetical protein
MRIAHKLISSDPLVMPLHSGRPLHHLPPLILKVLAALLPAQRLAAGTVLPLIMMMTMPPSP